MCVYFASHVCTVHDTRYWQVLYEFANRSVCPSDAITHFKTCIDSAFELVSGLWREDCDGEIDEEMGMRV